jgi:hypothetical protein
LDRDVELYFNNIKIGTINHQFLFNDEVYSGREICPGCLLVLHDFKYRVEKVDVTDKGYIAYLTRA